MNDTTPNDASVPFPDKEERDALILEFQRLSARLTRAGLMSRASSSRLMRSTNQERRYAEDKRHAFPELVLAILLAIEDGTLKEREHFLRLKDDHVALHLESEAPALFHAGRGPARDLDLARRGAASRPLRRLHRRRRLPEALRNRERLHRTLRLHDAPV